MYRQVKGDMMLALSCVVPLLAGLVFRFLIPPAESWLVAYTGGAVIAPYYPLLDLFLACIAPMMLCFATTMILLEEVDDKVSRTYSVSPLGKGGYLLVRLGVPAAVALLANLLVLALFSLSGTGGLRIFLAAGLGCIQALIISMLIIVFSKNKLEGMAVTKISAITLLGLPAPYFLDGPLGFVPAFLPSYWMGRFSQTDSLIPALAAVLLSAIWILLLSRKFMRKLSC